MFEPSGKTYMLLGVESILFGSWASVEQTESLRPESFKES